MLVAPSSYCEPGLTLERESHTHEGEQIQLTTNYTRVASCSSHFVHRVQVDLRVSALQVLHTKGTIEASSIQEQWLLLVEVHLCDASITITFL